MNRHFHIRLRRNAFLLLSLAGLFALTGISRSLSMLPPYHDFYVTGDVQRAGGPVFEGYTVGLFHKDGRYDEYRLLFDERSGARQAITLTRDNGEFSIRARTYEQVDSLTTGVILPGDTLFSANAFAVADVRRQEMVVRGELPAEGTCDSPEPYDYVEGYFYDQNPHQIITVP